MASTVLGDTERGLVSRYSEAQRRTIDAAMELFADHGVAGTSYQMVANSLGVTKAAIYHQFKTKASLVLAVAEVGLAPIEGAVEEAERQPRTKEAREALLRRVIEEAVTRRRWAAALQADPVMTQVIGANEHFTDLINRLYSLLLGFEPDESLRTRTAIISAAIGGALANPMLADIDDGTLQVELLAVARQLFNLND